MKIKLLECVPLVMEGRVHVAGEVIDWPDDAAARRMIAARIAIEDPATVAARKKAEAEAKAAADKAAAEAKKKAAAAAKAEVALPKDAREKMVAAPSQKPE